MQKSRSNILSAQLVSHPIHSIVEIICFRNPFHPKIYIWRNRFLLQEQPYQLYDQSGIPVTFCY